MPPKRRTTKRMARLLQRYYPGVPTDFEHFSSIAGEYLKDASRILDLGAGTGMIDSLDWKGRGRRVVGIDPDPRVSGHPFLDDCALGDGYSLPFLDNSFDAVVSVNVLEHIEDPRSILREVRRVLKRGGFVLIKTPNQNHYVARMASLTPGWFHRWYNSLRGRATVDTFETVYRFNRFEEIQRCAEETGFEVTSLEAFEGIPEYLLLSSFLFYPGLWYERWVNAKSARNKWGASIEAILRKPG